MQLQHKLQSTESLRFEPLAVISVAETLKLAVWSSILFHQARPTTTTDGRSFKSVVAQDHYAAALPAVSYSLATIFQSLGARRLDLLPYLTLSQFKIVATPFFSGLLLRRRYSTKQWLCAFCIVLGIVVVQLETTRTTGTTAAPPLSDTTTQQQQLAGLFCMLASGICVSFAGVYSERLFKADAAVGFMVRNTQMSAYELAFVLCGIVWRRLDAIASIRGFHPLTWFFIALQATGGFLVASCIYVISAVGKNYAQCVGYMAATVVPLATSPHMLSLQVRLSPLRPHSSLPAHPGTESSGTIVTVWCFPGSRLGFWNRCSGSTETTDYYSRRCRDENQTSG